jgi:hypothetical protein
MLEVRTSFSPISRYAATWLAGVKLAIAGCFDDTTMTRSFYFDDYPVPTVARDDLQVSGTSKVLLTSTQTTDDAAGPRVLDSDVDKAVVASTQETSSDSPRSDRDVVVS